MPHIKVWPLLPIVKTAQQQYRTEAEPTFERRLCRGCGRVTWHTVTQFSDAIEFQCDDCGMTVIERPHGCGITELSE